MTLIALLHFEKAEKIIKQNILPMEIVEMLRICVRV